MNDNLVRGSRILTAAVSDDDAVDTVDVYQHQDRIAKMYAGRVIQIKSFDS